MIADWNSASYGGLRGTSELILCFWFRSMSGPSLYHQSLLRTSRQQRPRREQRHRPFQHLGRLSRRAGRQASRELSARLAGAHAEFLSTFCTSGCTVRHTSCYAKQGRSSTGSAESHRHLNKQHAANNTFPRSHKHTTFFTQSTGDGHHITRAASWTSSDTSECSYNTSAGRIAIKCSCGRTTCAAASADARIVKRSRANAPSPFRLSLHVSIAPPMFISQLSQHSQNSVKNSWPSAFSTLVVMQRVASSHNSAIETAYLEISHQFAPI